MGRIIIGIVVGVIIANVIIFAVEAIGHIIDPLPVNVVDMESLSAHLMANPIPALLFPLIAYPLGAFIGAIATHIIFKGADIWPGLTVGGIVTLGVLTNISQIEHPMWFEVLALLLPIPFSYLGIMLKQKRTTD